jgi:transaldolase
MPTTTLAAFRDHGQAAVQIAEDLDAARALPGLLAALGIELEDVAQRLEAEGVQKFLEPYEQLLAALGRGIAASADGSSNAARRRAR